MRNSLVAHCSVTVRQCTMSILSLTIKLINTKRSTVIAKVIQFDENAMVRDCIGIIHQRMLESRLESILLVGEAANPCADDYGLFQPYIVNKIDKGRWLAAEKPLRVYGLSNDDVLEYLKKVGLLRVKLMDGTQESLIVDLSHNVDKLVRQFSGHIGITTPEEYSLILDQASEAEQLKDSRPGTLKCEKSQGCSAVGATTDWLDHYESLRTQGIGETEVLIFKRKIFFLKLHHNSIEVHLQFHQLQKDVVDDVLWCTKQEAIQLAALQCQVDLGDYEHTKHKALNLPRFLPHVYTKTKRITDDLIIAEHRKLHGMSEANAKLQYIKLCQSLPTYGVMFFQVQEEVKGHNKPVPILLGISKDSILGADAGSKSIKWKWKLSQLYQWRCLLDMLTFDFGKYSDHKYSVKTTEGKCISDMINSYINFTVMKYCNDQELTKQGVNKETEDKLSDACTGQTDPVLSNKPDQQSRKSEMDMYRIQKKNVLYIERKSSPDSRASISSASSKQSEIASSFYQHLEHLKNTQQIKSNNSEQIAGINASVNKLAEDAMGVEKRFDKLLQNVALAADKNIHELIYYGKQCCDELQQTYTQQLQQLILQLSCTQQHLLGMLTMVTSARLWVISHDQFIIEREIGRGTWATVHEATFQGATVAAKCLPGLVTTSEFKTLFQQEMEIALQCHHQNIVTFFGATIEGPPVILRELMDVSLKKACEQGRILDHQIHGIFHDVAKALHFLHTRPDPVIHCVVSSANVLLKVLYNGEWLAKLGDLGTAKIQQQTTTPSFGKIAPDAGDCTKFSPKIDVYSFGTLIIETLTQAHPFEMVDIPKIQVRKHYPQYYQLVTSCTKQQSSDRPTMYDVLVKLDKIGAAVM